MPLLILLVANSTEDSKDYFYRFHNDAYSVCSYQMKKKSKKWNNTWKKRRFILRLFQFFQLRK
jgi:hypothetical protein